MTSLSNANITSEAVLPISAFSYRNVGTPLVESANHESRHSANAEKSQSATKEIAQQEIDWLVQAARTEATAETRAEMQAEMASRLALEAEKTRKAIESFQDQQKTYFSKVETEVVQLSLAIAARILHRESQVDPTLVAGIVRVAIEKLHNGSSVTIRIPPSASAKWRERLKGLEAAYEISLVEDAQMGPNDCVLETELGSADFSIETQLKEVERGFFDLLTLRPQG